MVKLNPLSSLIVSLLALLAGPAAWASPPSEEGPKLEQIEQIEDPSADADGEASEAPDPDAAEAGAAEAGAADGAADGAAEASATEASAAEAPVQEEEPEPELPVWGTLEILGEEVAPGESRDLSLPVSETYIGLTVDVPVMVIRGMTEGPTLCLTAGIHGDELNGIEVVRESLEKIRPQNLVGTVIGAPIVNIHGFQTSSRYLPDRRDLNRFFPGNARGSSASRIARRFFREVVQKCDALIDLHTGSSHRSNLPQVRGDLRDPAILELATSFGATAIVHSAGAKGTLRRAAHDVGIPSIIYEAGEPMRFQAQEIKRGVIGVRNVMLHMKMTRGNRVSLGEPRTYFKTEWVRADRGGILVSEVQLGDMVREGDILGTITDPIRKESVVVLSPHRGRILGMAVAPVMIPGYAAFHIGVPGATPDEANEPMDFEHPE